MPNRFRTIIEKGYERQNINLKYRTHNTVQPFAQETFVHNQLNGDTVNEAQVDTSFKGDKLEYMLEKENDGPAIALFKDGFEKEYRYTVLPDVTQIAKFTFNGRVWVQDFPNNVELLDVSPT